MLLSVVSVLVVAQSSSEVPEGLMNNPVQLDAREVSVLCDYFAPRFRCHNGFVDMVGRRGGGGG